MLEERALVAHVRAVVHDPDRMLPEKLPARLTSAFTNAFLHLGVFGRTTPRLPRLDFEVHAWGDGFEPDRLQYDLRGEVRVRAAGGRDVEGIPARFGVLQVGDLLSVELIELNENAVTNGPHERGWTLVRTLNESTLLDAIRDRYPDCDRWLFAAEPDDAVDRL